MNVRDLIDELSKYPPHVEVRVFIPTIYGSFDDKGNFMPERIIPLSKDTDSAIADIVRYEGSHILIESK